MKKIYNKLVLLRAIIIYLKDPKDVESVLELGNIMSTESSKVQFKKRIEDLKQIKGMIQHNYGSESFDLDTIKNCAQGSLGYEFYKYLTDNNLDPNFYTHKLPKADTTAETYILHRIRKTHDLWHLATGFNTSEEGEAGLIAFYYAQLRTPLSGLIVVLAFIHFLRKRKKDLPLLLNEVTKGWSLGNKAMPLLDIKWEDQWNTSLKKLLTDLNLNYDLITK